jgi:hypothetical protein
MAKQHADEVIPGINSFGMLIGAMLDSDFLQKITRNDLENLRKERYIYHRLGVLSCKNKISRFAVPSYFFYLRFSGLFWTGVLCDL